MKQGGTMDDVRIVGFRMMVPLAPFLWLELVHYLVAWLSCVNGPGRLVDLYVPNRFQDYGAAEFVYASHGAAFHALLVAGFASILSTYVAETAKQAVRLRRVLVRAWFPAMAVLYGHMVLADAKDLLTGGCADWSYLFWLNCVANLIMAYTYTPYGFAEVADLFRKATASRRSLP